jgi:hypothetical protein
LGDSRIGCGLIQDGKHRDVCHGGSGSASFWFWRSCSTQGGEGQSRDAGRTRRLSGLAETYDGGSRSDAARIGWRLIDLAQWVFEEFRVSISKQTLRREVLTMGFRKLSARPRYHVQDVEAPADFKNAWPAPFASDFAIWSGQSAANYPVSGP